MTAAERQSLEIVIQILDRLERKHDKTDARVERLEQRALIEDTMRAEHDKVVAQIRRVPARVIAAALIVEQVIIGAVALFAALR